MTHSALWRVTLRPDPLKDPRPLPASNRWWLALWVMLSSAVHGSLGLALPSAGAVAPPLTYAATEVFDIDPPPPPPVPPDPPAAPAIPRAALPQSPSPSPRTPRSSPPSPPQLAAAVLTARDDAAPLDFTDQFVTGRATMFAGGATSSRGAPGPGLHPAAGVAPAPPAAAGQGPSRDLSRRPSVVGGFAWSCPFPPAADAGGIDLAVVQLKILVNARGALDEVVVMTDPGHGFGAAARRCALGKQFRPAHDRTGAAVGSELVVRVRFTR